MDKKAFGKLLQKYREEAGFGQEKLAEEIKRSSIFISYMERGEKSPSVDTLIQISNTLKIPVDLLIGTYVQNNSTSRLLYLEERMSPLSTPIQQKLLDAFEALINLELAYEKSCDGGCK